MGSEIERKPDGTRVFLTCDVEVWPADPGVSWSLHQGDVDRDLYGRCAEGEFGVGYQADLLDAFGLHGVFFVEPFFAEVLGAPALEALVGRVQRGGHDVQLHLHTEWLPYFDSPLGDLRGQHMKDFGLADQTKLIELGLEKLRGAGARSVTAFRAGNFGGNRDTLRAVAANDLAFDSTCNPGLPHGEPCHITGDRVLLQPEPMEGVVVYPVSVFRQPFGRLRHAQVTACSVREIVSLLLHAEAHRWPVVVLVFHSFELLRPGRTRAPRLDHAVTRRFEQLCRFLGTHRDRFPTATFADLDPAPPNLSRAILSVHQARATDTGLRYLEQMGRRLRR